jgi:hypothetical protein
VRAPDKVPLVPLGFVTTTSASPLEPAGKLAWMVLMFATETSAAGTPPTVTLAPAAKSLPEMVTAVPPFVGPVFGVMLGDVAVPKGLLVVKLKAKDGDTWPSTLVTVMLADPAAKEGVRQVTVAFGETRRVTVQFTPEAVSPAVLLKSTVAPGSKLVPVIVSAIPPASGLERVEMDAIAGAKKLGGV